MKKKTYLMIMIPIQMFFLLGSILTVYRQSICGIGFNSETNEIAVGIESFYGHNVVIYNEDNSLKSHFEITTRGGFKLQVKNNQIEIDTNGDSCRMIFNFNGDLILKEFKAQISETSLKINEPIKMNDATRIKYNKNYFGYETIVKSMSEAEVNILHNSVEMYINKLIIALLFAFFPIIANRIIYKKMFGNQESDWKLNGPFPIPMKMVCMILRK